MVDLLYYTWKKTQEVYGNATKRSEYRNGVHALARSSQATAKDLCFLRTYSLWWCSL